MQMQILVSSDSLQFLAVTSDDPSTLQLMLLRLIHFQLHVFFLLLWKLLEAFENIVLLLSDMFWKTLGNNSARGSTGSITQYVLILSLSGNSKIISKSNFITSLMAHATSLHPWWLIGINSCRRQNHVVAPRAYAPMKHHFFYN